MRQKFIMVLAAFLLATPAFAQTPPEVLEPYKAHRAALEKGDIDKASDYAYKAWQKSEELLGDHKTTGDLAHNYGYLSTSKSRQKKTHEKRKKAIKRSIELVSYYTENAEGIELERRLRLAHHDMALSTVRKNQLIPQSNLSNFKAVEKALDKYSMRGTTYEADLEALKANYYQRRQDPEKALIHADRALEIFETRSDNLTSEYLYFARIFRGDTFSDLDQKIPAVLDYQTVMQNLEGSLPSDHDFIKLAFRKWMLMRAQLEDAGKLEEAEAAGLCECWPYEDYKDKAVPLLRVPPTMPRRARRSGHVNIMFDVDNNGKPFNIREINSTEQVFVAPALKSVEAWRYSALDAGEDDKNRKNVATRVSFKLTDMYGKLIPEPK